MIVNVLVDIDQISLILIYFNKYQWIFVFICIMIFFSKIIDLLLQMKLIFIYYFVLNIFIKLVMIKVFLWVKFCLEKI